MGQRRRSPAGRFYCAVRNAKSALGAVAHGLKIVAKSLDRKCARGLYPQAWISRTDHEDRSNAGDLQLKTALSPAAAADLVPDGAVVMIGGFMGVGSPNRIIAALVSRGARNLTIIANDTARPGVGIGILIAAGCVAKVIASHIGTNPETQKLMLAGALEVDLVPQGTLAERIRAGGAGLGGVLTTTGLGTLASEGQQVVQLNGRDYLIAPALRADVALVAARSADCSAISSTR